MNAAVDSEYDSDQHSLNSAEDVASSVADPPVDVTQPFSDAIQNYVPNNGKC